ncbi:FAD:protein FMN transferase [Nocardioides sp. MH1]|uniref:FAD:protein FMN transferase n=1 Tax=Nocardioides sp. MH1 TaxID=3242490 RepID=UPI0035225604
MRRHSFEVMGTVVSLALRGRHEEGAAADVAWAAVQDRLRWADATFSTYRPDSVVNRWGRGELAAREAPRELVEVLGLAEEARTASGGAFDIRAVRSPYGGGPDPSGVVKGWAVQRAAAVLEGLADTDYCLAAGGDLVCRTRRAGAAPWRIGIEDPDDPSRTIGVLQIANGAVATSGTAHRGAHVVDPRTGRPATGLRQVTVVAPTLIEADIEATAAFVLGGGGIEWLRARGRTGLAVTSTEVLPFGPPEVARLGRPA